MTKYIWRQVEVWVGIEGTRWTAVVAQQWTPKTDFSFEETMETIQDESSIGIIVDARDNFVSKRFWEGEFGGNVEVNSLGYFLLATLWEVSSEVDTSWAYKHSFELANTNQTQSLTLTVKDPVIGDVRYPLASVETMTISAEEGAFATFTVTFKSKPWTDTTVSSNYNLDYKLLARHSIFRTAANLAGLGAASDVCLRSFEITFEKNLEDDYCLGSISPEDFINQAFMVTGSFTAVFKNEVFRDFALEGVKRAIRFSLVNTDVTIGATSNPRLTIDLPLASFTKFSRTQGNDETVVQTLTFKWLYSQVDTSAVNVELVNTIAEYVANGS